MKGYLEWDADDGGVLGQCFCFRVINHHAVMEARYA